MVLSAPINNPEVASCLGGTHGGLLRLAVAKHSVIVESDVVVGRRSRHRADVLGRRPQGPAHWATSAGRWIQAKKPATRIAIVFAITLHRNARSVAMEAPFLLVFHGILSMLKI